LSEQLSASQEDLCCTEFIDPQYPVVHDARHFPTAVTKKAPLFWTHLHSPSWIYCERIL